MTQQDPITFNRLSLVVPVSSRDHSQIRSLLDSLVVSSLQSHHFEVILVAEELAALESELFDDSSTEFSFEVSLFANPQPGNVSAARNLGWSKSQGQVVLFLDSDCLCLEPQFLPNLLLHHKENPDVAGFGGYYQNVAESTCLDQAYNWICNLWLWRHHQKGHGPLLGGNFSLKKGLGLDSLFDENIAHAGEEWTLWQKATAHRNSLQWLEAHSIGHRPAKTWQSFLRRAIEQGRAKARKNPMTTSATESPSTPSTPRWPAPPIRSFLHAAVFLGVMQATALRQKTRA